jgi:hypothetical protein
MDNLLYFIVLPLHACEVVTNRTGILRVANKILINTSPTGLPASLSPLRPFIMPCGFSSFFTRLMRKISSGVKVSI